MLNLIRNDDFIFDNAAVFPERYAGEDDFFSGKVDMQPFDEWDIPIPIACSNFFADIYAIEFAEWNRGVDTRGMIYELANGVLGAHTVEIPGGTFSKIHRHGPGAHVLWLQGEGYSLIWPEGGEKHEGGLGPRHADRAAQLVVAHARRDEPRARPVTWR